MVQQWGGAIQEMNQGDVVWIPPGVKHWHGATATEQMTHTAIQERLAGKNVEWLEKSATINIRISVAPRLGVRT